MVSLRFIELHPVSRAHNRASSVLHPPLGSNSINHHHYVESRHSSGSENKIRATGLRRAAGTALCHHDGDRRDRRNLGGNRLTNSTPTSPSLNILEYT